MSGDADGPQVVIPRGLGRRPRARWEGDQERGGKGSGDASIESRVGLRTGGLSHCASGAEWLV